MPAIIKQNSPVPETNDYYQTRISTQAVLPHTFQNFALDFKSVIITKLWDYEMSSFICRTLAFILFIYISSQRCSVLRAWRLICHLTLPGELGCITTQTPNGAAAWMDAQTHSERRGPHLLHIESQNAYISSQIFNSSVPIYPTSWMRSSKPRALCLARDQN